MKEETGMQPNSGWGNALPTASAKPADLIDKVIAVYVLRHVPDFGLNSYSEKDKAGRPNDGVIVDVIDFGDSRGQLHTPANVVVVQGAVWMTGTLVMKLKNCVGQGPFLISIVRGINKQGGNKYEVSPQHLNMNAVNAAKAWEASLDGGLYVPSTPESLEVYAEKAKAATAAYLANKAAQEANQTQHGFATPQGWAPQGYPQPQQQWGPPPQQAPQQQWQQPQQAPQQWGPPPQNQPQQAPQQWQTPQQQAPHPAVQQWGGATPEQPQQQQAPQQWNQPPDNNPSWGSSQPTQQPAGQMSTQQAMMAAGFGGSQQNPNPPF
jgi:hypothetical protein